MIENYLLEQFVAFAKYGTLLKTSKELHISQPSLSRSMRKLEDEFGISLFDRQNSKIALNETGRVAVKYATRALEDNQEMIDRVIAFDRAKRILSIGSCAPSPLNQIMTILQEHLKGKTIASELGNDDQLITGLKNRAYQLIILHDQPDDKNLFCQRLADENLYISLPEDSPLAKKETISLDELKGMRILMDGSVGYWKEICLRKLSASDLLIQTSFEALDELVGASRLPVFNSDHYLALGYQPEGRISIPISDEEAHVTYWLTTLASEQKTYRRIFNAARGSVIRKGH